MLVNSVQYNPYNNVRKTPSFSGRNIIDLNYILEKKAHLLPERILTRVRERISEKPLPTLMQVHKETYAPLLKCETLQDAQLLFPEFLGMKEANISFKRKTGNIRKLEESGCLKEGFSLKLLQDFWVKLKSQDEVAKELGLESRTSLAWVLQKIGFVSYNTNYKALLNASDPESRAIIASKTMAWNAAHPDLVKVRNKHAAQYMKKPENRAAHSLRMKKHFEEHPERRRLISKNSTEYWSSSAHRQEQSRRGVEYLKNHPEKRENMSKISKSAWEKIPEIRAVMSSFFKDYVAGDVVLSARLKNVLDKKTLKLPLTDYDKMILAKFRKACISAHPEIKEALSKAYQEVRNERKL